MMDANRNVKEIALLAELVERLRTNPHFMAHVLSTYQQRMGLDDGSLARELDKPPEMIVRLALCKRPDVNSATFDEDLRELSDYTLVDEKVLSLVIRSCCSEDGGSIPAASRPPDVRRPVAGGPSRLWASSAERFASVFTGRALTVAISLAILLVVGGILLWRSLRGSQHAVEHRLDVQLACPIRASPYKFQ